jgi:hypothetical protein
MVAERLNFFFLAAKVPSVWEAPKIRRAFAVMLLMRTILCVASTLLLATTLLSVRADSPPNQVTLFELDSASDSPVLMSITSTAPDSKETRRIIRMQPAPSVPVLAPGVYKAEPFSLLVYVPAPIDEKIVQGGTSRGSPQMPTVRPPLRLVPVR